MADKNPKRKRDDATEDVNLAPEEEHQVRKRASVDSYVVHEVIRRQGEDELSLPAMSLFWSGLAAGVAISTSVFGQAVLQENLPDTSWRPIISSFGYTIGFLIVILGRMQLFTESTLSAIIPVATKPTGRNFLRLGRLWSIVFGANMIGTLLIAVFLSMNMIGYATQVDSMVALSRHLLERSAMETLTAAIPAGFLLAAVGWSLPVGRGQEFWVILFFTYFIALGGFAHVVAGSVEAWLLVLAGEADLYFAVFGFILPALVGNIIGGTLIFALLAHAQVSSEIDAAQ